MDWALQAYFYADLSILRIFDRGISFAFARLVCLWHGLSARQRRVNVRHGLPDWAGYSPACSRKGEGFIEPSLC
jgi:hypothetical protein